MSTLDIESAKPDIETIKFGISCLDSNDKLLFIGGFRDPITEFNMQHFRQLIQITLPNVVQKYPDFYLRVASEEELKEYKDKVSNGTFPTVDSYQLLENAELKLRKESGQIH